VRQPTLAHLRFPVEQARGRRFPEPSHPYRNEFQRDRDRIVHSRAFRRLENKTQVFAPAISDHFRNRLTHTIEVSQIARTVSGVLGLDEDFTEALALAHDIGHPPFGHAGEAELDRIMSRYGDRFNHNLHALRLVEELETGYARFPGLNLTFEVREGIVKHSADFAPGEIPALDEYLPGLRPPLEAQLIDLCDEIAYNTADLDDGFIAGLITMAEVREEVTRFRELDDQMDFQFPGVADRVKMREIVRGLINWLVSSLMDGTVTAAHGLADVDEIRANPNRIARFSSEAMIGASELKDFLRGHVYNSERLEIGRRQSAGRIRTMFDLFLEDPHRMPAAYLEEHAEQPVFRTVCDYIAGMTDVFFERVRVQMNIP